MLAAYRNGVELLVRAARCLSEGRAAIRCDACTVACPADAVTVTASGPSVSAACLGCGRCAAACPTGALMTADRPHLQSAIKRDAGGRLIIACQRVSSIGGNAIGVTMKCLAALSPADWLELLLAANGRGLQPVDPGVCETCPAGGEARPWQASLSRARSLLAQAKLPPDLIGDAIICEDPEIEPAPAQGRRRLLGMVAPVGTRITILREQPIPAGCRTAGKKSVASQPREARALEQLARDLGREPPPEIMPAAVVGSDCTGCGVCAAVCPTGAIAIEDAGIHLRQVSFEGMQCIHCNRCSASCDPQAIAITPQGGPGAREIVRTLTLRSCASCEEPFAGPGSETLCPACAKSNALGAIGLGRLGPGIDSTLISTFATRE